MITKIEKRKLRQLIRDNIPLLVHTDLVCTTATDPGPNVNRQVNMVRKVSVGIIEVGTSRVYLSIERTDGSILFIHFFAGVEVVL